MVITGETFTQSPYVLRDVLNNTKVKFIQHECGTLDIMPNVEFVFIQKFLISSEEGCLKFKGLLLEEAHKMHFWGNTKKIATSLKNSKVFLKKLFFFSAL